MSKTIYYGHHQFKYGTKVEEYELKVINNYFSDENICIVNPSTGIKQGRAENAIMTDCLSAVRNCDIFVFSSMSGVIGKGLYTEIQTALLNNKPIFEIYGNTLTKVNDIEFELLNSDTPREYAVYKVF